MVEFGWAEYPPYRILPKPMIERSHPAQAAFSKSTHMQVVEILLEESVLVFFGRDSEVLSDFV